MSASALRHGSSSPADPARPFAGRVALVTGAAGGIGRATASLLAERGATVVAVDVAEIEDPGPAALVLRVDVTDESSVAEMVATTVEEFGRLDVAVNNAGVPGTFGPLEDQRLADWDRTLAVNLTAVFLAMRAEIPVMLDTVDEPRPDHGDVGHAGSVVNVASAAGLMGMANLPAYVASKHGVVGLTRSVALEYARRGVRVNAVCPGTVRTPMLSGFVGGDEEALVGMGRATPSGRLILPEEVAEAIAWLCSDAASSVTGHALAVDGGVLAT